MKLWLITQSVNTTYDTYDSAVVAAETEELARHTYPGREAEWSQAREAWISGKGAFVRAESDWAPPADVSVKLIGDASLGTEPGVILASFNAG